jgi:hypothetical protein
VGGDVRRSIDKDKAGEVAHNVEEISVATVVRNVAGGP